MSFSRQTVYAGQQAASTQVLQQQRDAAKSLFQFIADSMGGTSSKFSGLSATPGTGLTVNIGTGSVMQYLPIDPTAQSTLAADTSSWLLQGLVTSSQNLTGFAAPSTAGQSINYLIECQIQVTDNAAVSTPFYNSSNTASPTYLQKSPSRQNVVAFQVKAGTAATTGSQTTPAADTGWIPLYAVTVDNGETSLTSADIVLASGAPQFSGFVAINPNGNTPVYLNPASQQTGNINVSGSVASGIGGTYNSGGFTFANGAYAGSAGLSVIASSNSIQIAGVTGQIALLTSNSGAAGFLAVDSTGTLGVQNNINLNGSISYRGSHAGTDADPYPLSQLNVAMLGGKLASDYALAAGNYVTLYSGAPTLGTGNAGVTGYLQSGVATGTAPLVVASTTLVANLNANYLGGYAAGNASGSIPVSNGTLNTNLNAQYLNGMASSAFQPAGSYAAMNATNTGSFTVTGTINGTGGTGSTQVQIAYTATNTSGFNAGGPISFVYSATAPLALSAGSVRTNCPVYVGDGTRQNIYMQDVIPSGVIRSGLIPYRVTRLASYSPSPAPLVPGTNEDYGVTATVNGALNMPSGVPGVAETISFRTLLTVNATTTISMHFRYNDSLTVYVDGVSQSIVLSGACTFTLSAGQHTIDITIAYDGSSNDDHLLMFGWIPYASGQVSSAIVSAVPG